MQMRMAPGQRVFAVAVSLLASLAGPSGPARAEFTFEVVKSFGAPDSSPNPLVVGPDGAFYGTTLFGGSSGKGLVFRLDLDGNLIRLHSFAGSDGAHPLGAMVVGNGGVLYGGTQDGGGEGMGTLFRVDTAGTFTALHSFSSAEGRPQALAVARDGTLYGSTFRTIFRFDNGGTFTSLAPLNGVYWPLVPRSDGSLIGVNGSTAIRIDPTGHVTELGNIHGTFASPLVAGSDGSVYGVTISGGKAGAGTAFRIDGDGNVTTLHDFDFSEGNPQTLPVIGSDGALYGGTGYSQGTGSPAGSWGVFYRVDAAGNFSIVHAFDGTGIIDSAWEPLVLGSDGAIYGTTTGFLFRLDPAGAFSKLNSLSGIANSGSLIVGSDGATYGTTRSGGRSNIGSVLRLDSAGYVATLYSFGAPNDGSSPASALTLGGDGALYGTTTFGGPSNLGTIFRIDGAGGFASLRAFEGADGALGSTAEWWNQTEFFYASSLVAGPDGVLGTTPGGGDGGGTVFQIDGTGDFHLLHSFSGPEGPPRPSLLLNGGGVVYGTTLYGGSTGFGTIFRIDSAGTFTPIHSFPGMYGTSRYLDLISAGDTVYGATAWNGVSSVFQIVPAAIFSELESEAAPVGFHPPLVVGSNGVVYGITPSTVFGIDSAGSFNQLYSFAKDYPRDSVLTGSALLARGPDGAVYGATPGYFCSDFGAPCFCSDLGGPCFTGGGSFLKIDASGVLSLLPELPLSLSSAGLLTREGTLYQLASNSIHRIDAAGNSTLVHTLDPELVGEPSSDLVQGNDCAIYGTTRSGGLNGGGAVYRVYEVGHLCQQIDFAPLEERHFGEKPFHLGASAASGLPVSFTAGGSCTVSGNQVTLTGGGLCTLTASQSGDANYQPAPEVSQSFNVLFDFSGFLRPVLDPPAVNRVKAGQTVPIRFALGVDASRDILAEGSPSVRAVPCDATAPVHNIEGVITGRSSLLLHARKSDRYTYLWKTDKHWAGTCQEFTLELIDGTVHQASFSFRSPPRFGWRDERD